MSKMYDVLKTTIAGGSYKLSDVQHRIKRMFLLGDLNEAQMDELLTMAADEATVEAERPETLALIQALRETLIAIEARVEQLERLCNIFMGAINPDEDQTEASQYPAWKPWDGISTDYAEGAIVSHNGELWQSILAGQNVWEPGVVGSDKLWVKYTANGDAN